MWRPGPRNILSAVFFHTWKKRIVSENVAGHSFLKENRLVMFSSENGPTTEKTSTHGVKATYYLSCYISVCLSICWTSLIYEPTSKSSRSFCALRYLEILATANGIPSAVLNVVRHEWSSFVFISKTLVTTHLVFLHCLSLEFPIASDNMYSDRCEALAPGIF